MTRWEAIRISGVCQWRARSGSIAGIIRGRRPMIPSGEDVILPVLLVFMAIIAVVIVIYWQNMTNLKVVIWCLIAIGFLIYGPVMLVGVQALDLAPKNAAGTAAGFTGFMGYVLGTAVLANVVMGYVSQHWGWGSTFILLLVACVLCIVLMGMTYKAENYLVKK